MNLERFVFFFKYKFPRELVGGQRKLTDLYKWGHFMKRIGLMKYEVLPDSITKLQFR